MKKTAVRVLMSTIALSLITGCAATALKPGAERIIVSKTSAPKGCKFLGSIVGEQGGSLGGAWTSNKNLAMGAMNDMKNQALELGANYVQIETERAGVTGHGDQYSSSLQQTDVTQTGNAYKCNPADIGLE